MAQSSKVRLRFSALKNIAGWFGRTDFELFREFLQAQSRLNIDGAVTEIGVHHGKSFAALATFGGASPLYAIDPFDDQSGNIDNSGKGDKQRFLDVLKRFSINRDRVVIDERLSNDVSPQDILNSVGSVRFFHIDGGHHLDAVQSDIRLAVDTLSDGGVIAIDDMFRPEWPEVSMGAFASEALRAGDFVCFCIGFNKAYFCKRTHVEIYQKELQKSNILSAFLAKKYSPRDEAILIFQKYPLPEWSTRKLFSWWLSVYKPSTYAFLRSVRRSMRWSRPSAVARPKARGASVSVREAVR